MHSLNHSKNLSNQNELKKGKTKRRDKATYSAPKRAAAAPNVPQPQPKSATTLLLTSSKEFSA